jgi:hypothetical protein
LWIYDGSPGGKLINPAAFAFPAATELQGTLGRNALRGFGAWQTDLGLHRDFKLSERGILQFRLELFNLLNHPNFANPNAPFPRSLAWPSTTPGAIAIDMPGMRSTQMLGRGFGGGGNSGGYNPLFQIGGPRAVQLGLRLQF